MNMLEKKINSLIHLVIGLVILMLRKRVLESMKTQKLQLESTYCIFMGRKMLKSIYIEK